MITVIATGIDGDSPVRNQALTENPIIEDDPNQESFDLDESIENMETSDSNSEGNGSSEIDELHPLGDDEHFEIPAFLRKPKK